MRSSPQKPRRWDYIFGILTVVTIIWFGFILYNDFKSSDTDTHVNNTENKTLNNAIAAKDNDSTIIKGNMWTINSGSVICIDAGRVAEAIKARFQAVMRRVQYVF